MFKNTAFLVQEGFSHKGCEIADGIFSRAISFLLRKFTPQLSSHHNHNTGQIKRGVGRCNDDILQKGNFSIGPKALPQLDLH